jgi:hypothetical protein
MNTVGWFGAAVLVSRSDRIDCGASISWSIASVLTRKLPLPASKVMVPTLTSIQRWRCWRDISYGIVVKSPKSRNQNSNKWNGAFSRESGQD